MARPVAPAAAALGKGDRTRRRILDAAAQVFARNGNVAANLNEIATAAQLKAGSLYFHFDSKDALVAAVLEVGITESTEHLTRAIEAAGKATDRRLLAAITAHFDVRKELSDYAVVLIGVLRTDAQVVGESEKLRRRYTKLWLELIEEAQADGHLPAALDARLVRSLLFGAMNTALLGRWSAREAAATLAALLNLQQDRGGKARQDSNSR